MDTYAPNLKPTRAAVARPGHAAGALTAPALDLQRLDQWFDGTLPLTRREAHRLLQAALVAGYLHERREEHVAAIKALAGTAHWQSGRYRLLPDS